jgi:hypothetical protein
LAPRLKKWYHQIWEANLQPLGPMFMHFFDILTTFINNLKPNNKPKMLKIGP